METKSLLRTFLFYIVLQLTSLIVYSQCANTSNIYSFNYSGKSYEIVKETKSWVDASACAVERGGYLVEIGSLAEQNAVYSAILASGIPNNYKPIGDGGGTSYIWIGATDKNVEGTWLWDGNNNNTGTHFWTGEGAAGANNGTPVGGSYINWGGTSTTVVQEPDNYNNQDASAIGLTGWPYGSTSLGIAGEWNDINIANTIYYIIEYDYLIGINEKEKTQNLCSVGPNPCHDKLFFINQSKVENLKIYNYQGMMVYENTLIPYGETAIDVSSFSQGVYIMLIEEAKHNFQTIKFIKG
jgi:hypothetical protein